MEAVIRSEDESAWLRTHSCRVRADHDMISVVTCEEQPNDRCSENREYENNGFVALVIFKPSKFLGEMRSSSKYRKAFVWHMDGKRASPTIGRSHDAALCRYTIRDVIIRKGAAFEDAAKRPEAGSASQIISLYFKDEDACRFHGELRKRHILTSVFVYPAFPKGISIARFSVYSELL